MTYPKTNPKKLKPIVKQLDSLIRQIVRARDKRCVLCGSVHMIEVGHYAKRRFYGVRWDLRNCNVLCHACNQRDELSPAIYQDWILDKYGIEVESELKGIREAVKPIEQHAIYAELTEIAKQYGVKVGKLVEI